VGRDGRLAEYPPEPPDDAASGAVERQWGTFAGEEAALAAYFGVPPHILDRRPPTLFEGVAGLTTIYRVRPAEAEVTCGVGWHGTVPFVLVADFPGLSGASGLSPDEQDLIDAALSTQGLMAVQTRYDDRGPAVIARAETNEALLVIRVINGKADIQPYQPGDGETGTDDQRRWIRYAESIEGLTILDAWNDGLTDDLVVVTRGLQGDINRHYIDPDGVEVGRDPDPDAPAAQFMPDGSLPPDMPDLDVEDPPEADPPVPPNTVLALH